MKVHKKYDDLEEQKKQILNEIRSCRKCRMCVDMCPTYEGWFSQSSMGRLTAINFHFKYGLGNIEELSKMLFNCTTCRRCEERCKMVSVGVSPVDIIIKARKLLVEMAEVREKEKL